MRRMAIRGGGKVDRQRKRAARPFALHQAAAELGNRAGLLAAAEQKLDQEPVRHLPDAVQRSMRSAVTLLPRRDAGHALAKHFDAPAPQRSPEAWLLHGPRLRWAADAVVPN